MLKDISKTMLFSVALCVAALSAVRVLAGLVAGLCVGGCF